MKTVRYFVLFAMFCGGIGWMSPTIVSAVSFDPKTTVFVEAESFADKGGWVVDPQFYDSMGSPMLLAHGLGVPVPKATTNVVFPTAGTYHVFVRTRNWVSPWTTEHAPGKFQLSVNDTKLDTVFGTQGNDWTWQSGGTFQLLSAEKPVQLGLHDLTGFDGRVDALCFSTNPSFIPPNDKHKEFGDLYRFRRAATKLPAIAPAAEGGPFDLVVVGGGIAGVCTAVAAARLGLDVALIQDRPLVGGNNSSEVRVHLQGRTNLPPYPNLGNLVMQLNHSRSGNAMPADYYEDSKKMDLVAAESRVKTFFNTRAIAVEMANGKEGVGNTAGQGGKMVAVIGKHVETGAKYRFAAPLFADCTGDGTIGFLAGADWRMGRESRTETDESQAPETADKMTMGASVQWNTIDTGAPTTFPELPWAIQFTAESIKPMINGDWDWETGLHFDQIYDFERIRDHGLRAAYGHWSYMKNHAAGEWTDRVKNRNFAWVAYIAGKRESRRLLGDVILQEQDVVNQRPWDDASVTTTWTIDLHYPEAKNSKFFPGEEFMTIAKHVRIQPYAIPYRCFYSRNVPNLFMAGRNISVTHVALGTIRVQRTGGMMGEVVGMAASLCKKYDILPRGVYDKHLDELKSLMEKGVAPPPPTAATQGKTVVLPKPPVWLDKAGRNLAPTASVTVSSLHASGTYAAKFVNDKDVRMDSNTARWVSHETDDMPIVTLTWDKPVSLNAVRLLSGQTGSGTPTTPITDFVLQVEKDGKWTDIQGTKTSGNESCDIGIRFQDTTTAKLRLRVDATPGGLARLWEWEVYHLTP